MSESEFNLAIIAKSKELRLKEADLRRHQLEKLNYAAHPMNQSMIQSNYSKIIQEIAKYQQDIRQLNNEIKNLRENRNAAFPPERKPVTTSDVRRDHGERGSSSEQALSQPTAISNDELKIKILKVIDRLSEYCKKENPNGERVSLSEAENNLVKIRRAVEISDPATTSYNSTSDYLVKLSKTIKQEEVNREQVDQKSGHRTHM